MVFKGSGPSALGSSPSVVGQASQLTQPFISFIPVIQEGSTRAVKVLLGDGAAKATASGGWAVVSRPKQKGFTTWEGYEPYQMTIKVMFDGMETDTTVEHEYDALRRIMRVPVGSTKQPSPVLLVGPVPLTGLRWVIQNLDPDESGIVRRQSDGHLVRCPATVTLIEYVEADVVMALKPSPAKAAAERKAATPGKPPAARTYTVVRGDTLSKIAQRFLGSYKRYPEIARLNGIRDPNRIRAGQVLRLP